jgi:hypothetical protein
MVNFEIADLKMLKAQNKLNKDHMVPCVRDIVLTNIRNWNNILPPKD